MTQTMAGFVGYPHIHKEKEKKKQKKKEKRLLLFYNYKILKIGLDKGVHLTVARKIATIAWAVMKSGKAFEMQKMSQAFQK